MKLAALILVLRHELLGGDTWHSISGTQGRPGRYERPCWKVWRRISWWRRKWWDFIEWASVELGAYNDKSPLLDQDGKTEYYYASKDPECGE